MTAHSVALTGLTGSTLYHFRVRSRDAAGNLAVSGDVTFTTLTPPDVTAPTVSITAPTGGTISGTVSVDAAASDNVGIVGVQFKVDGVNLGAEDTSTPYSVAWNTTSATNGTHTLSAVARDAAGNVADVRISYPCDLMTQMLEYSADRRAANRTRRGVAEL